MQRSFQKQPHMLLKQIQWPSIHSEKIVWVQQFFDETITVLGELSKPWQTDYHPDQK